MPPDQRPPAPTAALAFLQAEEQRLIKAIGAVAAMALHADGCQAREQDEAERRRLEALLAQTRANIARLQS